MRLRKILLHVNVYIDMYIVAHTIVLNQSQSLYNHHGIVSG